MERERLKLSLFTDDMILYRENPKESTKKTTIRINKFSKVVGYKLSITNYQKEKLTILFTIASKRIPRNKFNQGGRRPVLGKL